jgi:hypothetical protein
MNMMSNSVSSYGSGERAVAKILSKYLLIGRYEGHSMDRLPEHGRVFIRAVRAIQIIGAVQTVLRKIGFYDSVWNILGVFK